MTTTSIQIDSKTRKKLAALKSSDRETYDEILNKLISLIPEGDDEGKYTDSFRLGLLEARIATREGRTVSHEDVKKRLGF